MYIRKVIVELSSKQNSFHVRRFLRTPKCSQAVGWRWWSVLCKRLAAWHSDMLPRLGLTWIEIATTIRYCLIYLESLSLDSHRYSFHPLYSVADLFSPQKKTLLTAGAIESGASGLARKHRVEALGFGVPQISQGIRFKWQESLGMHERREMAGVP